MLSSNTRLKLVIEAKTRIQVSPLWGFKVWCLRVAINLQNLYGNSIAFASRSFDHSLSARLISPYGFGVVQLSVQPNRCTIWTESSQAHSKSFRNLLNHLRMFAFQRRNPVRSICAKSGGDDYFAKLCFSFSAENQQCSRFCLFPSSVSDEPLLEKPNPNLIRLSLSFNDLTL